MTWSPNPEGIQPGDLYEDGFLHPCLCIGIEGGFAWGISLIDGSQPRMCGLTMCGIRKLSLAEAWEMKCRFRADEAG